VYLSPGLDARIRRDDERMPSKLALAKCHLYNLHVCVSQRVASGVCVSITNKSSVGCISVDRILVLEILLAKKALELGLEV